MASLLRQARRAPPIWRSSSPFPCTTQGSSRRHFAQEASTSQETGLAVIPEAMPIKYPAMPESSKTPIKVREDHGLWHFFRRKEVDVTVPGAGDQPPETIKEWRYETVEVPDVTQRAAGRSWRAQELRLKSFADLHALWYICLRERNVLATQKEEARRMGVTNHRILTSQVRVVQCRKTMARIKYVLNERRLAYLGARELLIKQAEEADKLLHASKTQEEGEALKKQREEKRTQVLAQREQELEALRAHLAMPEEELEAMFGAQGASYVEDEHWVEENSGSKGKP